jgi:hypothetical protein
LLLLGDGGHRRREDKCKCPHARAGAKHGGISLCIRKRDVTIVMAKILKGHAMKRWFRRIGIAAVLLVVAAGVFFECVTHVGRGRWGGEPFYEGRPASYWANEIERWETKDPDWTTQTYVRRPVLPGWADRILPEAHWPSLLDGDPNALPVLQALRNHPSVDVQNWAQVGIERIDNGERGPHKIKHPSVIMTAQLYEVDEAFYKQLAGAKWRSLAELEEMERIFLQPRDKEEPGPSLQELLDKQKILLGAREIKLDVNKEETLLSLTKEITCLPSPAQLRKGLNGPQKIDEGWMLRAQAQASSDRRYVRVTFIEKDTKLEGIDKVRLDFDPKAPIAEIACVKESTLSRQRTIPDGATYFLPMQYRPADTEAKDRWLVAVITPRIYIEAEERLTRQFGK